jgi:hypothetical protein
MIKSQSMTQVSTNKSLFFFIIVLLIVILLNALFYVLAFKNPPELIEAPQQRHSIPSHLINQPETQPETQQGNQP